MPVPPAPALRRAVSGSAVGDDDVRISGSERAARVRLGRAAPGSARPGLGERRPQRPAGSELIPLL